MAQAAVAPHASSLHSLAIIQINGSGGTRKDKNLKNGASLCAKAAALAHVDAMRELGHCLPEGRRLLLEANAREAAAAVSSSPRAFVETALQFASQSVRGRCYFRHHQNIHNNSYRSILVSKPEVSAAMAARTVTTEGTLSTSHSAQPSPPSSSSVAMESSQAGFDEYQKFVWRMNPPRYDKQNTSVLSSFFLSFFCSMHFLVFTLIDNC